MAKKQAWDDLPAATKRSMVNTRLANHRQNLYTYHLNTVEGQPVDQAAVDDLTAKITALEEELTAIPDDSAPAPTQNVGTP